MRLKKVILIALILSLFLTTGCDYIDYEDLTLISAIGIDFDETTDQVTVTVQYMATSTAGSSQESGSGSKTKPSPLVIRASGLNISDALSKIQQATGNKLFYSYMEAVVIGENAAKFILMDTLQFAERTPHIRTTASLVITTGKAEKVLSTYDERISAPAGKNIRSLVKQSLRTGTAFPVSIQDFIEKLVITGRQPVAPLITVEYMDDSQDKSSSGNTDDQGPVIYGQLRKGYYKVNGIAVFQGEKFIGCLDAKESTGLGYILNKNLKPYEYVTYAEDDTKNTLIFQVVKSKSNISVRIDDDKPVFTINTHLEAFLMKDINNNDLTLLTPEVIDMLNKELANSVHSEIDSAIQKGQKEYATDIFDFGFDFYRKDPALWKIQFKDNWKDIFPDIQIDVDVTAKVINTGSSIKEFSAE